MGDFVCVSVYSEKKKKSKQKLSKTLLLIIFASVSNDVNDRYQAVWTFYKYFFESEI